MAYGQAKGLADKLLEERTITKAVHTNMVSELLREAGIADDSHALHDSEPEE
jgi:hypothetical protein